MLLLEDDAIINCATTEMMQEMGCRVSPFMHLASALGAIRSDPPDVAVLDVKINEETSYQLAEELHQRGVPIIFLTGYGLGLQEKWRSFPICQKPCVPAELKALLSAALTSRRDICA